ncbi:MFS transporter [Pseudonocardia oroxyli]|uniref:Predicted arabinose efflux permease, MFS family n=1 Tax=Pseudonocardia oroxyli TaxID=366584 RepID=A0A1G8EBZ2_PSEOR|nr:MFS transporter [Pseudonocardia oroxyli]SDH67377.1 Predicted arabinose efflux permease, MFS family [Pseudonocardia oroxyli]
MQDTGRRLVVTAGGTLLAMTAFTAPLSIVPAVAADLGAGAVATSWILSSMSLGLAVALLPAGSFGDETGRRRVFVAGAVLLAAGSAACGLAPGPGLFVAGRIVEGIGAAAVIACGLALISHTVPAGPERLRAIGIWGACMGAGPAVGPLLGSVGEALSSWRWAYLVITVAAVALAAAGRSLLPESRSERHRGVDLVGAALLGIGLGCLLAALTQGRQGWTGPWVLGLAAAAVVFLAVFLGHQRRARSPMLELHLFRRPALVSATLAAFVTGATIIALMSFLSTVLERGLAHNAVVAAAILLSWSGTSVVAALLARRIPARVSGGARMAAGLLVLAVGLLPIAVLTTATPLVQLILGLVVTGAGTGVVNATLGREAVASVPPTDAGAGSGINNTSRYVGAALGVTVATVIALPGGADAGGLVAGWNVATALGIGLAVLGAVAVLVLQSTETRVAVR